ncbi:MAG: DUF6875 domain-containing protein [Nannocystaceae bacterium]
MESSALTPFYALGDVLRAELAGGLAGVDDADFGVLGEVARWTRDFLSAPHPELGRVGDVCPYSAVSVREGLLLAAVCHVFDADPRPAMRQVMEHTLVEFEARSPRFGNRVGLKAMLVLFPSLESEWIEDVQDSESLRFAQRGLMLGEFHAESEVPGLHNPRFRPLRSPIPLLGIRAMVPTDLPFLTGSDDQLDCYLRRFEDAGLKQIAAFLRAPHAEIDPDAIRRLESALYGLR